MNSPSAPPPTILAACHGPASLPPIAKSAQGQCANWQASRLSAPGGEARPYSGANPANRPSGSNQIPPCFRKQANEALSLRPARRRKQIEELGGMALPDDGEAVACSRPNERFPVELGGSDHRGRSHCWQHSRRIDRSICRLGLLALAAFDPHWSLLRT